MGRSNGDLRQKASLSQVFLNQTWPCQRVVDRLKTWGVSRVLEIGPGGGVLTKMLVANQFDVTAVERDPRFAEVLTDWARTESQPLKILNQDILKFDLVEWLQTSGAPTAVVGNIPYHISSPILLWALPHISLLKGIEFLVQLEFAQRVVASPGTKAYGSLTVYTQLRAVAELHCKVDRKCFSPIPAVDSALVSLVPYKNLELTDEVLERVEKVTRTCFMQRRKMLRNGIRQWMKEKDESKCPIDLNRRPETLSPGEYVELTDYLF